MRHQIALALLLVAAWVAAGCLAFMVIALKRWLVQVYGEWKYGRALSSPHPPFNDRLRKRIERRRKESARIVLIEPAAEREMSWRDLN